jgi:hypothetical protein
LAEFTRLLAFDVIVGNNVRHFYKWGVVLDVEGRCQLRFSPIYDTARALYRNTTDTQLAEQPSELLLEVSGPVQCEQSVVIVDHGGAVADADVADLGFLEQAIDVALVLLVERAGGFVESESP